MRSLKVLPYVAEMRKELEAILQIDIARINIKITTTEKLGFTGGERRNSSRGCLFVKHNDFDR